MPDMSLTELVLGVLAASGLGGTGVAIARRKPQPGTPEDHEQRLSTLERDSTAATARLTALEHRMTTAETAVAQAVGKLTESTDRVWQSVEKLSEKVDEMRDTLVRVDIETAVERELRKTRTPTGGER